MKTVTIAEIADAIGLSKRGAELRAGREGWPFEIQRVVGGRQRLYQTGKLPEDVRVACARVAFAAVDAPLAIAVPAAPEPTSVTVSGAPAEQRDARLAILAALDRFTSEAGLTRARADTLFCDAYEAGSIEVAPWVRTAVRNVTPRTLFRWRAALKSGATHRLAVDKGAARRGKGILDIANDGAVRDTLLAAMAKQPHLSADTLRDLIADRFGVELVLPTGEVVELPILRTFQTALKGWRERYAAELLAITHPDAFKSRRRVSGRLAHLVSRINELWQIDASPADVLTTDGRYSVYVAIDVFSRRILILVSKTPRAAAVGQLLRRAILEWGVPERIKTDNGSDFVAKYSQRVTAAIGIEIDPADPFSPEQKGVVERAIGTMQRDLMATLPGFIGHSVADRKAIEGRKAFAQRLGRSEDAAFSVDLSPADLQHYCDRWAAAVYATKPHSGLAGRTPLDVAASASGAIRTVDVRALDLLLAPVAGRDGIRTVGKEGVQVDRTIYIPSGVLPGTEVLVRQDPADLGRVMLFTPDGETYLGEAIAPELAGTDPAEAVARAQAAQAEHRRAGMAELKKVKFRPRDFADAKLRQGEARLAAAVITFPKREEKHETPALAAALAAAEPPAPAPVPESVLALQRRLLAEENVTPLRREETAHDRWKRVETIKARLDAGVPVNPNDLIWLGGYRAGPEFKGFAMTYGDPFEKENPAEAGI